MLADALVAIVVAIVVVVVASPAHATANSTQQAQLAEEWRTLFDTLLAAPQPVEWALDEPIEQVIDTLERMRTQFAASRLVEPTELAEAYYWLSIGTHRKRCLCDPSFEEAIRINRQSLLDKPRRLKLYAGSNGQNAPKGLRLDTYIERARANRFDACQLRLGKTLSDSIESIDGKDLDFVLELYAIYEENRDVRAREVENELIMLINRKISDHFGKSRFMRLPWARVTMQRFNAAFIELAVQPCLRVIEPQAIVGAPLLKRYIDYIGTYWKHRLDDQTRTWLELRHFCGLNFIASLTERAFEFYSLGKMLGKKF